VAARSTGGLVVATASGDAQVSVYDDNLQLKFDVQPYPGFTGGVNVGAGVFNGEDFLFVAQASRGGRVEGYSLKQKVSGRGGLIPAFDFAPFGEDFTGGVSVAGLAGAGPEPAVWLQLILGFGLAGAALRTRRRAAL